MAKLKKLQQLHNELLREYQAQNVMNKELVSILAAAMYQNGGTLSVTEADIDAVKDKFFHGTNEKGIITLTLTETVNKT